MMAYVVAIGYLLYFIFHVAGVYEPTPLAISLNLLLISLCFFAIGSDSRGNRS
ncbi:hypothetical protein J2S08_000246 [Bacillus chungangensis]|uniref:Uncharacterized protein n=1 Tax=Bacillus chungangensis TaxID=587633 RepID=A0ABT9WM91_9BACI|nr:hypothetical protein [Bacillus chungangensis]